MNKDTRKGIALAVAGIAIGVGYILYLSREMNSGVSEIRVSFSVVAVSLLVTFVGMMQSFLGADKTKKIMSFNTTSLTKRDLLAAAVMVVILLAVVVVMTIFLGSHGFTSF